MKNLYSILSITSAMLIGSADSLGQKQDVYINPSGKMMTHSQAQLAVYGDIINDALGGIDNNNGGRVYIYRTPSHSATPSRIYDGPTAPVSTGMYNAGGPFIRVFDLITDNTTQSAVPSGSLVNTASGAGDIEIEQELRVTNEHILLNGIIWTPRDKWQHAYLLYEDHGFHTGAGPNNSNGPHVDGYVAYEGKGSFVFPIGNGVVARKAGLKNPDQGIYRAAYFHRNPQLGTPGISGTSASTGPLGPDVIMVSTQEFWDIDGTGLTNITLSAQNGGQNYSAWNTDFAQYNGNTAVEFGIVGWDEWEYLGNQTPTNNVNAGGYYATSFPIKPDSFGTGGQPFGAFTWAVATASNFALKELSVEVSAQECDAHLRIHTLDEEDTKSAHVLRSKSNSLPIEIAEIPLRGNTIGDHYYHFTDTDIEDSQLYLYYVEVENLDGTIDKSNTVSFKSSCDQNAMWQVYPNPTSGKVRLQVNQDLNVSHIRVVDMHGRIVIAEEISSPQRLFELDLSNHATGNYIISLTDDQYNIVYRTYVLRQ